MAEYEQNPPLFDVLNTPTTQTVQHQAEGVEIAGPDYIEFMGEKFRLAEHVSIMPLAAFAESARRGMDTADMAGLAAMYRVIRSVIHRPPLVGADGARVIDPVTGRPARDESEWHRFEDIADNECEDPDDLMAVVDQAMEVIAARPPKRRATSSATSPATSQRSRASSSSPATRPGMDGMTPVGQLGH